MGAIQRVRSSGNFGEPDTEIFRLEERTAAMEVVTVVQKLAIGTHSFSFAQDSTGESNGFKLKAS